MHSSTSQISPGDFIQHGCQLGQRPPVPHLLHWVTGAARDGAELKTFTQTLSLHSHMLMSS